MDFHAFVILSALWLLFTASSSAFHYLNRNAALKRKLHPWLLWGMGSSLASATFWLEGEQMTPAHAAFVIVSTVAISLYYAKAVFFCDSDGRTKIRLYPFQKRMRCPECARGDGCPVK